MSLISGKIGVGANSRLPLYSVYSMDSSNEGAVVIGAKMAKRVLITLPFSGKNGAGAN